MGILKGLRQHLKRTFEARQREAVVDFLRKQLPTLTLDDLRHLLANPLGRGLGSLRIRDLLAAADGPPTKSTATPTSTSPRKRTKAVKKTARTAQKTASKPAKTRQRNASKTATTAPKTKAASKTPKNGQTAQEQLPPFPTTESYRAAVLAVIRGANGWIGAAEIRPRVQGTKMQMRLALQQHITSGTIIRKGERGATRYKYAGGEASATPQAAKPPKPNRTRAPEVTDATTGS